MLVQGLLKHKHKSCGHHLLIPDTQNPLPLLKTVNVWDPSIRQESSFPKTTFPSSTKVKALPMHAESRPLLTDEPLEFEKYPGQVPGYWKIRDGF